MSSFTLRVDPKTAVLDIQRKKLMGELSEHSISPDTAYKVTMVSHANYGNGIPIKKVAFYNTSNQNPFGWFYVVEEGKTLNFRTGKHGTDINKVYALFIDISSSDNTGYVELTFTPA